MTPWAEALFKVNKPSFDPGPSGFERPRESDHRQLDWMFFRQACRGSISIPFPMEIIQLSGRVIMLFEFDHFVRQIYTDGRGHNQDLAPTWMGDSIGKWEEDTLVVDTTNFNDKTWLDRGGHPHSEGLRLTERIRRVDHDTLERLHHRRPEGVYEDLDGKAILPVAAEVEHHGVNLRRQRQFP